MLGPPTSELVAGIQGLVVAVVLLGLGYLVADVFAGRRRLDEVDRCGLALTGLCVFAFVLMLVHMATSGWLYSHPLVVRLLVAGTVVGLGLRRIRNNERARGPLWLGLGLAALAVAVWASPVFRMMPLTATADTQLHNGWVDQLMAGETTPGAVLTGDIPNYYPWLFHSVGAVTTSITPGETPFHSLAPLHVLQVAGTVLALFALGRALTTRATTGVGAAVLGAMSGGFGFVMLRGLDVVTDPRGNDGADALRYQGDMLFSRSYNLSFHNLIPPFPRDLAFGLLISFVLLLALRARSASAWVDVASGISLGLVGLTGGETFIVGVVLVLAIVVFDAERKVATAARLLGPAVAVYAVWLVPVLVNYLRLDGFVSITHIIAVDLPATAIVLSWGLATPFAVIGGAAYASRARAERPVRLVALFVAVSGAMLVASALIPQVVGEAFDTLGRKHRYWPIFYLSVALVGALGFTWLLESVGRRSRAAAVAIVVVAFAVALASPVVATLATPDVVKPHDEVRDGMTRQDDSLLHVVRDAGPGCTIAAPQGVSREVFGFTGYRMLSWTGNWFGENRARIRWADIYDRITPEQERIDDNKLLTTRPDDARWGEVARRHDLDLVVVAADSPPPADLAPRPVTHGTDPYWVVQLQECAIA
ncbi:MAG TPA: hypothetical protein VG929_12180 [Actinomycetota bacterium]|nr:hypothetical protein [Actinomycetota bacterium]